MQQAESRTSLCAKYGVIRRRIETLKRNLLQDERELARLGEQIHSFVSLGGAMTHDGLFFGLDPADRKLLVAPYREAADLDHPDGPDALDPLSVVEATRERLFRDSRPVIEPEPDVDDLVEESAHVVEVGHRNGPRLIGRDL